MTEKMSAAEYRKNKNLSEYDEQVKLANYLDVKGFLWCHVPNGGNRNPITGAKLKEQGVKPGVPDVLIFQQGLKKTEMEYGYKIFVGVAIELKRRNGNSSSVRESQRNWLHSLEHKGWLTKVAFGADDAIDFLEGLEW